MLTGLDAPPLASSVHRFSTPNSALADETTPIVFIHGVGVGIAPYIHILRMIMKKYPNRPLLVIDVPCVSLRLGFEASGFEEVADVIAAAAHARGWSKISVFSHSYGTFVTSVLLKRHTSLVAGVCMVDPVCLLVCYPQLVRSFIYQTDDCKQVGVERAVFGVIRTLVARDYLVAHTLCRKLQWKDVQLWPS